jgi:hypothetical protein
MAVLGFIRSLFERKIIIGIHGLENKPPRELLDRWWRDSMKEGLARIGRPVGSINFELVYWADYFYERPQDPAVKKKKDPCFLDDPYLPTDKPVSDFKPSVIKKKVLDFVEKQLDNLFFDEKRGIQFEKITNFIVQRLFRDLDVYYHKNCVTARYATRKAMESLREELAKVIRKHRRKKIMLISHSMGTIISYDVFSHVVPDVKIDTFITIGSPLGLPIIMKKIFQERGLEFRKGAVAPAPENIMRRWLNFSDLSDPVAANYNLSDDYAPNSLGVGPVDCIVENDYILDGRVRPHKLYGYLRVPPVSWAIYNFLKGK